MIPVKRVRKPRGFDKKVKNPGDAWVLAHPKAKRPRALWAAYLPKLEDGFRGLCGYAAMLDPTGGTVDHYLSFEAHPDLAYAWSNYRFASNVMNSTKKNADATVLDPHEVGPDWFEIILPSLQLRVSAKVPAKFRAKAEFTLTRLKLDKGRRVVKWRKRWHDLYEAGGLTLDGLERVAPLLAAAVRSQLSSAKPTPGKKR